MDFNDLNEDLDGNVDEDGIEEDLMFDHSMNDVLKDVFDDYELRRLRDKYIFPVIERKK